MEEDYKFIKSVALNDYPRRLGGISRAAVARGIYKDICRQSPGCFVAWILEPTH